MTEHGRFSDLYRAFEDRFRGTETLIRERMSIYMPLVRAIPAEAGVERKALDIGCGRGEWLSLLESEGWQALGVDSNTSMATVARASNLTVVVADALEYLRAAPAASFSLVTAFHVVEHVPNDTLIEILAETARVLTPNGLVILETPNPENLTVASWSFHMDPTHHKPLPPALLQFLVENAGLATACVLRLNGMRGQVRGAPSSPLLSLLVNGPDFAVVATNATQDDAFAGAVLAFVERTSEPNPVDLAALARFSASVDDMPSAIGALRSEIDGLRVQLATASNDREQIWTELSRQQATALADLAAAVAGTNARIEAATRESAALDTKRMEAADQREQALADLLQTQGRIIAAALAQIAESQTLHQSNLSRMGDQHERYPARPEDDRRPVAGGEPHPGSASRSLLAAFGGLWAVRGVKAWLGMKPGSRPRRVLRAGVFQGRDLVQNHPRLRRLAHRSLQLSPRIQHRVFAILAPPPEQGGQNDTLSDQAELALARLIQAEQACRSLAKHAPVRGSKPRLAFVSPVPPEQSGIADYSAQLLPALAAFYQVDIVSPAKITQTPLVGLVATRVTAEWFEANSSSYDRVVYQIGNSSHHSHMLSLLQKVPGIVVLHDLYLSDLFYHIATFDQQPGAFERAMYASHGFAPATLFNRDPAAIGDIVATYPASFPVLAQAQGVIVHSEHARSLAARFYPALNTADWQVVPLVRSIAMADTRDEARTKLGFGENVFLVCSFGYVQASKRSDTLLDAWLASPLAADPTCHLVFVGSVGDDGFGRAFMQKISAAGGNIRLTGYVDEARYQSYLAAADLGVQLRKTSRGETSAAALDCLTIGLPTIVNAIGSMAELPESVVMMLPGEFSSQELADALETMRNDRDRAHDLGEKSRHYIQENHSAAKVAAQYQAIIEAFHARSAPMNNAEAMVRAVGQNLALPSSKRKSLHQLAKDFAAGSVTVPQKRLFVDVSATARVDLRTGIQRVVRALLLELLRAPPPGFRIEPVWLQYEHDQWVYNHARDYTAAILGLENAQLHDTRVMPRSGDILLVADYFCVGVIGAYKQNLYKLWRETGVEIDFVVYDMLPVLRPDWFPPQAAPVHEEWSKCIAEAGDRLICISQSVADETRRWLAAHRGASIDVVGWALGADMDASSPSTGLPEDADDVLAAISRSHSFLMVGTVEPRKGHLQALEAFEVLWANGSDVQLVIVGAEGWKGVPADQCRNLPHILSRLNEHPELGRRLLWLKSVSDEYLDRIYASSRCLIAASEGEGFGLPLIEAARHGIAILARDIPVFREVAGPNATYFAASRPEQLAKAISDWLDDYEAGSRVPPDHMRWLTWAQSAARLKAIMLPESASREAFRAQH